VEEQSMVMSMHIVLFVCLSVCLHAYLRNRVSEFRQNFYEYGLWSWLGHPVKVL